ncbi:hypothetical protein LTR22_021857 [Elasticomyces elasticus]|nr:hypothetical protein LTR22_021857 [Elasticomyces elasticus]KAK5758455.1 hypothetical protein LTS12_011477 [Elasticomyces elasticus]
MAIFTTPPPASQDPQSSLRLPAQKRISAPTAARLSTITESSQPKGVLRPTSSSTRPTLSRGTPRSGPPAYTWVPEAINDDEDLQAPVEGEKVAESRRNGSGQRGRTRGGWGRILLVVGLILAVVALAVGLGVGLTKKKHKQQEDGSSQPAGTTPDVGQVEQQFPLGEYSFITALRTVATSCTSNAATWRCYPYSIFDPAESSTNTSSLATFNWIVSNTSANYATDLTTGEDVPSNLTISSTNNPFSITFGNQSLTYVPGSSNNASSARYEFSFTQQKSVIPSSSILSSGAAAICYYNATTFTGTLYLDARSTFPGAYVADATGIGGYAPWPYAVEITQTSGGGDGVPDCYQSVNGGVGQRILTATTPEPEGKAAPALMCQKQQRAVPSKQLSIMDWQHDHPRSARQDAPDAVSQGGSNLKTHLLAIPLKLRKVIYEMVFEQSFREVQVAIAWGSPLVTAVNLLEVAAPDKALLLTSRQIYIEAHALYKSMYRRFWRETKFYMRCPKPGTPRNPIRVNFTEEDLAQIRHLRCFAHPGSIGNFPSGEWDLVRASRREWRVVRFVDITHFADPELVLEFDGLLGLNAKMQYKAACEDAKSTEDFVGITRRELWRLGGSWLDMRGSEHV